MTSLVSPLTRVSKAGVSDADFTTLESAVAANTSKPTAAAVDGQIDTKNAAQNLHRSTWTTRTGPQPITRARSIPRPKLMPHWPSKGQPRNWRQSPRMQIRCRP